MTGTLINAATVILGSALGLLFGARLPERLRQTIVAALGLFTLALGVRMFLQTQNPILALCGLLIGGLLGEWWRIEDGLQALGARLEARFVRSDSSSAGSERFVRGFLTASLLFCVGPMTILGSIQDGLSGDYSLLATKAVLDGFAALALSSTLGLGVVFSVAVILVYQGGLSLLAGRAGAILSSAMIAEMTAVGGLLIMGLAISSLLSIKSIRVGNLLPGLVAAPLLVWLQAPIAALFHTLFG